MELFTVSKDFSKAKYSDLALIGKTEHVLTSMTGNPDFDEPTPTLVSIKTACETFATAVSKMKSGNLQNTILKNQLREVLVAQLKELADYVQRTSEGNSGIISGSGFDINKKATMVGPLAQATRLMIATTVNDGCVEASCDVVEHAAAYEFQYTEAPLSANSTWISVVSTKHKVLINGLVSGKQYVFRVAGTGSDPLRRWSEKVTRFIV